MLFGGGFVSIPMIQEIVVDGLAWVTLIFFMGCMLALVRFRMDLVWIIPSAGLVGGLLH